MSWKELLENEIENCIESLHDGDFSVEEYAKGIKTANDMAERLIKAESIELERNKFYTENANKAKALELEEERFKAEQTHKEKMLELERVKLESEQTSRTLASNSEARLKDRAMDIEDRKLKAEKKDRMIKNVLAAVTFVGGAAVTIWGTVYSDCFDATKIRDTEAGRFHIRNWLAFMKK